MSFGKRFIIALLNKPLALLGFVGILCGCVMMATCTYKEAAKMVRESK